MKGINNMGINYANIVPETTVDGEGLRYALYLSGCPHNCTGCHNAAVRKAKFGQPLTGEKLRDIVREIRENPLLDGITISGGDPFFRPEVLYEILKFFKIELNDINVWCWTGYTYEFLKENEKFSRCLNYIDVLVDGKYEETLNFGNSIFRGSANQRIIELTEGEFNKLWEEPKYSTYQSQYISGGG